MAIGMLWLNSKTARCQPTIKRGFLNKGPVMETEFYHYNDLILGHTLGKDSSYKGIYLIDDSALSCDQSMQQLSQDYYCIKVIQDQIKLTWKSFLSES